MVGYQEFDLQRAYTSGITSGTVSVSKSILDKEERLIAIESMSMYGGGRIFLINAPHQERPQDDEVRPDVVAIAKRLLTEHADVWTELAKY